MFTNGIVLSSVAILGTMLGMSMAQTITENTTVSWGIMVGGIITAFYVGVQLTNIKRDVRGLKKTISHLPCVEKDTCPEIQDEE